MFKGSWTDQLQNRIVLAAPMRGSQLLDQPAPQPRSQSLLRRLKLRVADVWFRRWVSEFEVDGLADMPAKQKACLSRFVFLVTFEFIPVWSGVPSDY